MARSPQIRRQPKRLARQVPGADGDVPIGRAFVLGVVDQKDAAAFRHQPQPPPGGGCQQLTAQPPGPATDPSAAIRASRKAGTSWGASPLGHARRHGCMINGQRRDRIESEDPTGPRRFDRAISFGGVLFMALAYWRARNTFMSASPQSNSLRSCVFEIGTSCQAGRLIDRAARRRSRRAVFHSAAAGCPKAPECAGNPVPRLLSSRRS